jgi:predicted SprT family Zn-dependent metalloprotease
MSATLEALTRVAVEFDKDDWSIGTVVKATPTGYKIDFDYGEKGKLIKLTEAKVVAVDQKRSYKKPMTAVQVKALKPKPVAKTPVAKTPVAKTPVAKTPVAKTPVAKTPVAKTPTTDTKKLSDESDSPEEGRLEHRLGDPGLWKLASAGGSSHKLMYMKHVWNKANKEFFANGLSMPGFRMMKEMQNFRGLGQWFPQRRVIGLSPRMFNATQAHAITTIVHEMCHQAVTDIEKAREDNGGHGPLWCSYMRKCGLTPSRYNQNDRTDFMTDKEKEATLKAKDNRAAAVLEKKQIQPNYNLPAQWHDPKTDKWHQGLIVCRADKAGSRWVFIENPVSSTWSKIPSTWFFELPHDQHFLYTLSSYQVAANKIREHLDVRSINAAVKRERKKTLTSMFGRF